MEEASARKESLTAKPAHETYHGLIRGLHWAMAIGFVLMWLSGVAVINAEGQPWWNENDRQGVLRDLHKSIGLTLLALVVVRLGARFVFPPPGLPAGISPLGRSAAHAGHIALYAAITLACVSGLAIADLQGFGNAWFGVALPPIAPRLERVAGWSVDPWSYVLHAIIAYGLLALVVGHAVAVWAHQRHGVDLSPRIAGNAGWRLVRGASLALAVTVALVFAFAANAWLTTGPEETPRDFRTTTPP